MNMFMDQERADFLTAKVGASSKTSLLTAWPRTSERELPVVELEVEWVRFSTLNHRTKAEQQREIHKSQKQDLFSEDPLGGAAQTAQYKILCGQTGFEDIKANLAERGQQENAIVTAEGILINGNRRAAALRSLYKDDNDLDARYIRCWVLPSDASPSELLQLETELQVAKDFKQDYSWVNEALLIEELYATYDRDFEKVAGLMHRDPKDVRAYYDKIQQVNQLVALSNSKWLHVDFEENETAFDELAKHIKNKNDKEKESVRSVYFLGTLTGVKYRNLRHLRRADADALVTEELKSDTQLADIIQNAESTAKSTSPSDDLLDDVLGSPTQTGLSRTILEFVAGLDRDGQVTLDNGVSIEVPNIYRQIENSITKAAEEAEEQQKDVDAVSAPLMRIERAMSELQRASDALPNARAIPGWDESEFEAKLENLSERIEQMRISLD